MLAPMITPIAWFSCIIPAFTKPTTITVVALELWITPVTNTPTKTAINLFLVRSSIIFFSLSPAAFCKPFPIKFIPYKNKPKPASNPNTIPIYMISS